MSKVERRAELTLSVEVGAPVGRTWEALVDWERQATWMLGTRVRATTPDAGGVGTMLEGFTGVGRIGILDTMVITVWEPPRRCVVLHTGRVVRGEGVFEVRPLGENRSLFVWSEFLDLPLGRLGALGWSLVRPAFRAGVLHSLRRFAQQTAEASPGGSPPGPGPAAA